MARRDLLSHSRAELDVPEVSMASGRRAGGALAVVAEKLHEFRQPGADTPVPAAASGQAKGWSACGARMSHEVPALQGCGCPIQVVFGAG